MCNPQQIMGLDIGATKICALIGEINEHSQLEIWGIGISKTHDIYREMMRNIEQTGQAIRQAVETAKLLAFSFNA